jgi:hypothetical protein
MRGKIHQESEFEIEFVSASKKSSFLKKIIPMENQYLNFAVPINGQDLCHPWTYMPHFCAAQIARADFVVPAA